MKNRLACKFTEIWFFFLPFFFVSTFQSPPRGSTLKNFDSIFEFLIFCGRAAVLQTSNNKKQTAALNKINNVSENSIRSHRGQPTDTRSGCQLRPPCGPVKRTYDKSSVKPNVTPKNTQLQKVCSAEATRPHNNAGHHVGACRMMDDSRVLVNPIPRWHYPLPTRMNERMKFHGLGHNGDVGCNHVG